MARKRIISISNVSKERRRHLFVKTLWILFGFVVLVIGLAFVSHIKKLLIQDISVSGNQIIKEEDVQKEAREILQEKRFFVFSGENKFIFSKNKLESGLKEFFPRILSIETNIENKNLHFTIVEREKSHLWCGEEPPTYNERSADQKCYFLDNSGFIFDEAPQFSSGVYFTFYSKLENENPIGQYILNFEFLKDIESFISGVKEEGFPVHSLVVKEDGQYELLFSLNSIAKDYPKLLFISDQSLSEVYNKFISAVTEEPFRTDFLENPNSLEYIDARFKNRIFYRFIQE